MPHTTGLLRVVQELSFCRDLGDVMSVLGRAARELTGADGITIVIREGDLCHYADENAIAPLWKGRRFPMAACISGWCMLHREQVAIVDIFADERIPHDAYRPTFVRSLAMTPIRRPDPIGAIGAYWAETHLSTEDELRLLQDLGDAAAVAIENARLIERLREANRRKDEFLAMLAHELRNPLTPIRNGLHVLRIRGSDGETAERAREMMERQVDHMARIVEDLLDVARLAGGKLALDRERIDLARLVRLSAEDRRNLLDLAGVRLLVDVPERPAWVMGDATRLAQVVDNLIDNAAKFTPRGGEVHVSVDVEPSGAVVRVRDTGIGIDGQMLPRLFESFAQADRSLDRHAGGLGLGLSVAKGLVELHGGAIEASSGGIGQGSEFTVRLAREAEPSALRDTPGVPAPAGTATRQRVLVVEDNGDAAASLRILLEVCGYEVTVAHSGPEGLEAAKKVRPDAVLCDIGLPGMDGFAVAGHLRRDAMTAKARLIAVTGYGLEEDRRRALDAGFDVHLVKPVNPEVLLGHLSLARGA